MNSRKKRSFLQRNVWQYIPLTSGIKYYISKEKKTFFGYVKHTAYFLAPKLLLWVAVGITTGSWGFWGQYKQIKKFIIKTSQEYSNSVPEKKDSANFYFGNMNSLEKSVED